NQRDGKHHQQRYGGDFHGLQRHKPILDDVHVDAVAKRGQQYIKDVPVELAKATALPDVDQDKDTQKGYCKTHSGSFRNLCSKKESPHYGYKKWGQRIKYAGK